MKKTPAIMMILVLIFSLITACADKPSEPIEDEHNYGKIIYVSPNGNDENSGEKDTPVASLTGAVKAMRDYRSQNGLPEGGIKIEFATGTYNVTEGITLTAEDSGTEDSPVVFAGANDAKVLFNGGISLNPADFMPADENFKALLQTEEAKQNVVMIDLAKAGCYDLNDTKDLGNLASGDDILTSMNFTAFRQELFVNGKRKTVARWPNEPYCHPEIDTTATTGDNGTEYTKILISDEKATIWRKNNAIRFYGMPKYEWSLCYLPAINVDKDSSALLFPADNGLTKDCMYYVFNIPQELDSPGEYYWDTTANILYYWPEEDINKEEIFFSQFTETPINFFNCTNLTFANLSAGYFRGGFLYGFGDHITISNCNIFDMGGSAVMYLKGNYNTVKGCLIHDLAAGGIVISTGDITTQTSGQTLITDNIFHDWAQIFTVYRPAAEINGIGAKISHNEFYNTHHSAIEICAAQCDVEYNDIHDVCLAAGDGGAIYTWGKFTWAGNVFRYNYIHQVGDIINTALGIERCGLGAGMFFDFWGRFSVCYGNVFVDVKGCCMCGASGHMTYENNLCINVGEPINISYWGVTEKPDIYDDTWIEDDIRLYDYLNQIWRYSSPRTALFVEVANQAITPNCKDLPLAAAYNIVRNNVRYIDTSANVKSFDCDNKEIYTKDGIIRTSDYYFALSPYMDNACYTDVDPGFTDYTNGDYRLKEDSRVFRDLIGFEPLDVSVAGPRASENPFK